MAKETRKAASLLSRRFACIAGYLFSGAFLLLAALLLPVGIRRRPEVVIGGLVLLRYACLLWVIARAEKVIRLRRRIQLAPTEPTNYFRLAVSLYERGYPGEATAVFRQGMRLDPGMLVETPEGAVRVLCKFGATERERRIIKVLCGLALMEHVVEEAGEFPRPLVDIMALGAAGEAVELEVLEVLDNIKSQREGVELLAQSLPPEAHEAWQHLDAERRWLERRIRDLEAIGRHRPP